MLQLAIDKFYSKYKFERLPVEIVWKKNMSDNTRSKYETKNKNEDIITINGYTVLPNEIGEISQIVLWDNHLHKSTYSYINSAIHELTHIHDQITFAKEFCNSCISKIREHELFFGLYVWTEFHAQYIGYEIFYETMIENEAMSFEYVINDIYKNQLPNCVAKLADKMSDTKIGFIYSLVHHIAEAMVWNKLSDGKIKFTDCIDDDINVLFPRIFRLYKLLNKMQDFDSAKILFSELEKTHDILADKFLELCNNL